MLKSRNLTKLALMVFFLELWAGLGTLQVQAAQLTDISGHWVQAQTQSLFDQGIIDGYPNGTFRPDAAVTRAEFIAMVNSAFGFEDQAPVNFRDVKPGDWFAAEIAKAQAAGYISGFSDGTVKPNEKITRQEMAIMLSKILQLKNDGTGELQKFSDATTIPGWSGPACAAMVRNGYLNGYPNGSFQPKNSSSRAMAAYVLYQVLDKDVKRPILKNVTVGEITPVITGTPAAPTLTFPVDTAARYKTGTMELSTAVDYQIIKDDIMVPGSAVPSDNFIQDALVLVDLFSQKPGDGASGQKLIEYSPVTLILSADGKQTTYTIRFVAS